MKLFWYPVDSGCFEVNSKSKIHPKMIYLTIFRDNAMICQSDWSERIFVNHENLVLIITLEIAYKKHFPSSYQNK